MQVSFQALEVFCFLGNRECSTPMQGHRQLDAQSSPLPVRGPLDRQNRPPDDKCAEAMAKV